jgi:PadR family transcriptional regulator PadR
MRSAVTATPPDTADALARKFRKEMSAGTVALVLLALLDQADEDLYGYQIAKRLTERARAPLATKQGVLYPVLRTLSAHGLLASRVVPSYAGPPRRYYRITPLGRQVLAEWSAIWRETRDFVDDLLGPTSNTEKSP